MMTVRELIKRLETLPPGQTVVTDLHSEYAEVCTVKLITGYQNGGYIAQARTEEQKLRERGYCYIGVRE